MTRPVTAAEVANRPHTKITKFPLAFYTDHCERDLPAPPPVAETKTHVWLDMLHPDFQELIDDAKHYADADGPDGAPHVTRAAKAFLRVVESWT